jgi:exonuclease VII large subunit
MVYFTSGSLMNFSRATFVLLLAALVLLAAFHFKDRAKQNDYFAEINEVLRELRGQIESQQQALAALESRIQTVHGQPFTSTPTADAALLSPELLNRVLTLLEEQSNALATVQKQLSRIPVESPREGRKLTQAGLDQLRQRHADESQKLKEALDKLESLRLSLSVPDELATMDDGLALYIQSLFLIGSSLRRDNCAISYSGLRRPFS